jgi:hypothetical protein
VEPHLIMNFTFALFLEEYPQGKKELENHYFIS